MMSAAAAAQPFVLSNYELGSRIGAGAAGSVYRAVDIRSGQDVVIKFFDGAEDGFETWASEMRLALRFRHDNIVACLDLGFDEGYALWAMIFTQAKGGSLRRAIASGQHFAPQRIAQLLLDIASALAYAHAQGVVHRDVKPENILARDASQGSAWMLTDFGAGRFLPRGEVARSVAGSAGYMAPEVLAGHGAAASDQFSLGVVGMELCIGRLPEIAERSALSDAMRPKSGLAGIIGRLTASDPAQRFSNMEEVVRRLKQELEQMSNGGDIIESLSRYLEERHGVSTDALGRLMSEWGERGTFADFLVQKNLLPRSMARTLEAVRNGYVDMSLDTVLGISRSAAPLIVEEALAPPPTEAAPPAAASAPEEPVAPPRAVEAARPVKVSRPMSGLRFGRYVLQEPLGEGATATVFRSFHEMLSIPVAIKVFEPIDSSSDPDAAQRFRREAQTLIRLEHPHIVRVLDVDISEQFPFIVMEYVGETTLSSQIRNLGRLPAMRIAQIGIAVADALEAAGKEGLLHRDVKPSNIIERKDGHIKLVDFGIAAKKNSNGALNDPQAAQGLVSGTPSYLAPEQAQNPESIDFRADMYGLGATLYHAAVGRPPFLRSTARETILAQINEEATSVTQIDPNFDLHLAWTIHRMLRKRPEDRFASWAEVKEALAHTLFFQDQPEVSIVVPGGAGGKGVDTQTVSNPAALRAVSLTATEPVDKQEPRPPSRTAPSTASLGGQVEILMNTLGQSFRGQLASLPTSTRLLAAGSLIFIVLLLLFRIAWGG